MLKKKKISFFWGGAGSYEKKVYSDGHQFYQYQQNICLFVLWGGEGVSQLVFILCLLVVCHIFFVCCVVALTFVLSSANVK